MMRREFLTAGTGAVVSPLLANPLLAMPAPDPHLAWFKEWRVVRAKWRALVDAISDETPESEAMWDRRSILDELLAVTPATTAEGVAAKLMWVFEDCDGEMEHAWYGAAIRQCIATLGGGDLVPEVQQ